MKRHRGLYSLGIGLTIVAGLTSRSQWAHLPPVVSKPAGDALWALLFFLIFGAVAPRASTRAIAILTAVFSASIEFSQLYQSDWINAIRGTYFGGALLGRGFHAWDLAWYAIGIASGAAAEIVSRKQPTAI